MKAVRVLRSIIVLLPLLMLESAYAQLSIEECHEKARNNYPLIQQFDLIEQSKDYTVSNANKAYLPQLEITAIGGIVDGFPSMSPGESASSSEMKLISVVQLNQTIWDGGITRSMKEIAEANAKIEKADVEVSLYSIKERVNNLFFGILLIDEQKDQLDLFKTTLEENLSIVTAAYESGVAYQSDIDEVQVELLNLQQKITELDFNRSAYTDMLALLIGEEIGSDTDFNPPLFGEDITSLEVKRPELDLFISQEEMVASKSRLDKSKIYPKLGLMGFGTFIQPGISFGQDETDRILIAGLSLSWEFGSVYKRSNDKKLGEIDLSKINNRRETFLFSTNVELTQVEQKIKKYQALMQQDEELVKLKTSIKNTYQAKYDNGVTNMSDLLIRINDENQAKQIFLAHEIQYLMALFEYKTTSGN